MCYNYNQRPKVVFLIWRNIVGDMVYMTYLETVIEHIKSLSAGAKLAYAGLFVLFAFLLVKSMSKNARVRRKIARGKIIYYKDFENNWIDGYKRNDRSGCYVITLYNHRLLSKRLYMHYENIYIGQSQNICQRVHNHLNGKGKGDVYADIKYGMEAYIRLIPCKEKKMNEKEKELIEAFHATESYNKTKGGAKGR